MNPLTENMFFHQFLKFGSVQFLINNINFYNISNSINKIAKLNHKYCNCLVRINHEIEFATQIFTNEIKYLIDNIAEKTCNENLYHAICLKMFNFKQKGRIPLKIAKADIHTSCPSFLYISYDMIPKNKEQCWELEFFGKDESVQPFKFKTTLHFNSLIKITREMLTNYHLNFLPPKQESNNFMVAILIMSNKNKNMSLGLEGIRFETNDLPILKYKCNKQELKQDFELDNFFETFSKGDLLLPFSQYDGYKIYPNCFFGSNLDEIKKDVVKYCRMPAFLSNVYQTDIENINYTKILTESSRSFIIFIYLDLSKSRDHLSILGKDLHQQEIRHNSVLVIKSHEFKNRYLFFQGNNVKLSFFY